MMVMTQLNRPRRRAATRRRGVLLLVVLGMLAMFAMIGVAFVLLTGHARRGAESLRKKEFYVAAPEKFTDAALQQILCGSKNTASVLRTHSLGEDMYGPPVDVTANGIDDDGDGTIDEPGETFATITLTPGASGLWTLPLANGWRYVGRILTMTEGPAKGKSTRIVGYGLPTAAAGFVSILAIQDVSITDCQNYITSTGPIHFIINGAPFSGTGFGYNPNASAGGPQLLAAYADWTFIDPSYLLPGQPTDPLLALFPNPAAFDDAYFGSTFYDDPSGPGGANEEYDAVDYQNMLLALQLSTGDVLSPSLHRPELINFWFSQLEDLVDTSVAPSNEQLFVNPTSFYDANIAGERTWIKAIRELKRRIILRPLQDYHPNFTGSNPNYWPLWDGTSGMVDTNGDSNLDMQPAWDVDNDADGKPDSIWVDLGLPIQTMKDGRRYKPLVAILCIDLDGRLNLNAHGSLAQVGGIAPVDCGQSIAGSPLTFAATDANRGQGCGPAEVNLSTLLGGSAPYLALLQGSGNYHGRYGVDAYPGGGSTQLPPTTNADTYFTSTLAGYGRPYDFSGYPFDYVGFAEPLAGFPTDFGSPIDLKGGMQVALDWRGQPVYQTVDVTGMAPIDLSTTAQNNALHAQPYELDLSPGAPRGASLTSPDAPFSPAELERLLRPYDVDTMNLPDRLEQLVPGLASPPSNRLITTESCDIASVPCAGLSAPMLSNLYSTLNTAYGGTVPVHIQDPSDPTKVSVKKWLDQFPVGVAQLLAAKLVTEDSAILPTLDANFATIGNALLGPELMAGLPLNLNRRFMSSADRLAMARQLYCLAMLLADLDYLDTVAWQTFVDVEPGVASPITKRQYSIRLLAQWAVNVVDFRHNDSIMTGFEYDEEPFVDNSATADNNPWDVDGDLATDDDGNSPPQYRAVVWGCARPELLITETLGLHDRRTTDDTVDGGTVEDGDDTDFDQRWQPEGSLFVEIYNPWSPNESSTVGGVNLKETTATGDSPVWRLAITECFGSPLTEKKDLNHPVAADRATLKRAVYFTPKGGVAVLPTDDGCPQFQPSQNLGGIDPVLPGKYALIGPGNPEDDGAGQSTTLFGFRNNMTPGSNPEEAQTRRIVLAPGKPDQVKVFGDGTNNCLTAAGLSIQKPTAIVINYPERLSVTEPEPKPSVAKPGEYETYTLTNYNATTGYSSPYPDPLDGAGPYWDANRLKLRDTGTYSGVFIVHLQRLADPTQGYNADTNPYVTMDKMPVDVTAFNAVTTGTNESKCPTDEGDDNQISLFARERGATVLANRTEPNLWAQDPIAHYVKKPTETQTSATKTVTGHNLSKAFSHSLGYLNGSYRDAGVLPINSTSVPGLPSSYVGSPPAPFPWLNWNDRPYVSKNELLLVPNTPASRLTACYGMSSTTANPYAFPENGTQTLKDLSFPHLPNFFDSSNNPTTTKAAELHRVLDYVRVPSRFINTREPIIGLSSAEEQIREITDRREPGRVNLNTVTDGTVWNAAVNVPGTVPFTYGIDPNLPTRFPNPFRSSRGLGLVPIQQLPNPFNREVNATLLREGSIPGTPVFNGMTHDDYNNVERNPYFRYLPLTRLGNNAGMRSNVYAVWVTVGYFEVESVAFTDNDGNSLDDVLFCDATAFITEAPKIYPDGVRLGQEVGADSGEIKRNRAFYIIDRSIPFGFERGKMHNAKDAVLIERSIE